MGLSNYYSELRIAACLVRTNNQAEGLAKYDRLLKKYPEARGVRTSYVVAVRREFQAALSALESFKFSMGDDEWVAHEFGRAYLGVASGTETPFLRSETQIALKPEPIVFHMLAQESIIGAEDKNRKVRVPSGRRNWYPEDKQLKITQLNLSG